MRLDIAKMLTLENGESDCPSSQRRCYHFHFFGHFIFYVFLSQEFAALFVILIFPAFLPFIIANLLLRTVCDYCGAEAKHWGNYFSLCGKCKINIMEEKQTNYDDEI